MKNKRKEKQLIAIPFPSALQVVLFGWQFGESEMPLDTKLSQASRIDLRASNFKGSFSLLTFFGMSSTSST